MNDGKCDPLGRMWSGTMYSKPADGVGSLYLLDRESAVHEIIPETRIPNGLAFGADAATLYFVDTALKRVDVVSLDQDGSAISREVLADLSGYPGGADGMAIDEDGCLWIAFAQGFQVRRITPEGQLDRVVDL